MSVNQKIQIFDAGIARSPSRTLGEHMSLGEFQWRTRRGDIVIRHVPMTEPLLLRMATFGIACGSGQAPVARARHGAESSVSSPPSINPLGAGALPWKSPGNPSPHTSPSCDRQKTFDPRT